MEAEREERLSSAIALIIAFATLVGAIVGYLQAETANASNDRRLQAEQLSLHAMAGTQREQQQAQISYESFARAVEQRTAAANALLQSLHAETGTPEERELLLEQERWLRLAEASAALSDIGPESEHGPERDPAFPARYFANATYESLRLNALQDAANEEASLLDQRASAYTAILAMIAISLYLFGLSLAERGPRLRRGFVGVGLVLLVVATGWTGLATVAATEPPDEEAAAAYARARVARDTAHDAAGFREAEAHYSRAIELRPTFARAYAERAGAIFLANTPQRGGFASIVPAEALQAARADLERAVELGLENAPTLGSLGFYGFVEGTQQGNVDLLEESIAYSRRAIELDPGEPVYRYNLGVALLAADRIDEAVAAYSEAVARTLYLDPERTELRQEPAIEEAWLAGALTDMAIVEQRRPDLAPTIRRLKEMIVGPVSSGTLDPLPASAVTFSELQLDLLPAELQWQARLNGYDSARHTVSTQWYHRDAAGHDWAVLPSVSGTAVPTLGRDGRHFHLVSYIASVSPPACLPPGQYRTEIYVNGRLSGELQGEAPVGPSEAVVARDITLAFCRPPEWQPVEAPLEGLLAGYESTDGQYGAFGIRYGFPRRFADLPDLTSTVMDLTLESFAEYLPGSATYLEEAGTSDDYFLGLSQPAWRWYDHGTGYVRVGAGLTADGAVMVGFVFGPYDWFDTDEPFEVLSSMVLFE